MQIDVKSHTVMASLSRESNWEDDKSPESGCRRLRAFLLAGMSVWVAPVSAFPQHPLKGYDGNQNALSDLDGRKLAGPGCFIGRRATDAESLGGGRVR